MGDASGKAPRVSVVVPAYNSAEIVGRTVRTALDQSFRDLELIVVDDGSPDATAEAVRRAAAGDPRLRLLVQENRGLAGARNRGIDEARGELIAFLDNDDLWLPDKIAAQVALLDERPSAAVASCYSALIDEQRACTGWRYGGKADGNVYDEMLEWDMVSGGSVAMVRRAALAAVGPFDSELAIRSDWDMWIRLARKYEFATVPRVLVGYTRRGSNMSREYEQMVQAGERVLEKAAREDPRFREAAHRHCRARDLFAVACLCTVDGDVSPGWHYLKRSLVVSPWPVLRRPRRWALIAMLLAQTVLPSAAQRRMLDGSARMLFGLPIGKPFHELGQ